ncbi:AraC family transcriptional regulator [Flavilitoribacter nigricans DSM 23189 = NBRC 102662]|uniref:AraC family transcriptional regulator n=2 Tax=Flavilitoribacter TaxID=2762562 RepID=A0A2D0NGZ1_FLAN2|nr:AraC family transcriptional regulator [Flavilitoribacter nigricans DSM 23189 = NBRC 102662]
MSADPENEYFSDGITEEIINALTKVQGLKVTARTSSFAFKNKNADVRSIGQQLGVATVLEGSVRKAGQKVRITAQLIQARNGFHLWARNFDRELKDIFAVQDEISLLIADQIRENFGHLEIQDHLIAAPTQNIQAYNLYLKARYNHLKWDSEGISQGIRYYQECIELDPGFALPYFGIGFSYAMRASWGGNNSLVQTAEEYLQKGARLDDQSYLGHFTRATISFWGKWDFKAGHREYQQAMALNPSFTEAEEGLAELYTVIGAFEKAMHHTQNILVLNPLSPNHYYTKGNILFLSRQYEAALESLHAGLQVDPNFLFAIEMSQLCYIMLQDYAGLDAFLQAHPQAQRPHMCRALYKLMYPDEAVDIDLKNAGVLDKAGSGTDLFPWHLYLQIYLGHHDLALDMLEEAVRNQSGKLASFRYSPLLEPLHTYDRFDALVRETFHPSRLPEETTAAAAEASGKKSLDEREVEHYMNTTVEVLEQEKLYLDPALSLKTLAERLDLHPNKLSRLLNDHIGKNFNEFVNSYRLETFKVLALDPANSHLTLLGLAYESGFNSKTVFNAFFKKMEGKTPRAWLKAAQLR